MSHGYDMGMPSQYAEGLQPGFYRTASPNVGHRENISDYAEPLYTQDRESEFFTSKKVLPPNQNADPLQDTEYLEALNDDLTEILSQYAMNWQEGHRLADRRAIILARKGLLQHILENHHTTLSALHAQHEEVLSDITDMCFEQEDVETAMQATHRHRAGIHDISNDAARADLISQYARNIGMLGDLSAERDLIRHRIVAVERTILRHESQREEMEEQVAEHGRQILEVYTWAQELENQAEELWGERHEWIMRGLRERRRAHMEMLDRSLGGWF